jgi:hypothetical protein
MAFSLKGLEGPGEVALQGGGAMAGMPSGKGVAPVTWGVGNPLVAAVGGFAKEWKKFADEQDDLAVNDFLSRKSREIQEFYTNPESGEFNVRKGEKAAGMYNEFQTSRRRALDEEAAGELNSHQLRILRPHLDRLINVWGPKIAQHESGSMLDSAVDKAKTAVFNAVNTIAASDGDPEIISQSADSIRVGIYAQGRAQGRSEEYMDMEVRREIGDALVKGAISMAAQNPVAAMGFLEHYKENIPPVMYGPARHTLRSKAETELVNLVKVRLLEGDEEGARSALREFTFGRSGLPRGMRNNNFLNLKLSSQRWEGKTAGGDGAFEKFETPEHGVKAAAERLLQIHDKGAGTIAEIAAVWAPPSENDTEAYAAAVAEEMGVSPGTKLDLRNSATLGKLVRAMGGRENGRAFGDVPDEPIRAGVEAALGERELPPGTALNAGGGESAGLPEAAPGGARRFEFLRPSTVLTLEKLIDGHGGKMRAEARGILAGEAKNAFAWFAERGDASLLDKVQDKLAKTGDSVSIREFLNQRAVHEDLRPAMEAVSGESFAAQNAAIMEWFDKRITPENAALMVAARKDILEAQRKKLDEFKKDPHAYAAALPDLRTAQQREAALPQPAARNDEQRIADNMERQAQLARGMGEYFEPKALSSADANAYKGILGNPEIPADKKMDALIGLSAKTGRHFKAALHQLKALAGVDAAMQLYMDNGLDGRGIALDMLSAALLPEKDTPKSDLTDSDVRSALADSRYMTFLRRMSEAFPGLQSMTAYHSGLQDAGAKLLKVKGPGALRQLDEPYDFVLDDRMVLRIPKQSALDPDDVEDGLRSVLENIREYRKDFSPEAARVAGNIGIWRSAGDEAELFIDGSRALSVPLAEAAGIALARRVGGEMFPDDESGPFE